MSTEQERTAFETWAEKRGVWPRLTHQEIFSAGYQAGRAALQSPEIQALKRDKERLDWLADQENSIGNVQLPTLCVERNLHSMRDAIDDAMEQK